MSSGRRYTSGCDTLSTSLTYLVMRENKAGSVDTSIRLFELRLDGSSTARHAATAGAMRPRMPVRYRSWSGWNTCRRSVSSERRWRAIWKSPRRCFSK